jgi:hypothetical protein
MAVLINGTTGITGPTWTTSGRPASPVAGQQGYNSTREAMEVYVGTSWRLMTDVFSPTGGTITTSGAYTIHTFNSSGTFTPNIAGEVEYLVIAGGGGSARQTWESGGGGAGGFLTATGFAVAATGLTVTIGAGGIGNATGGTPYTGTNGSNSVFSTITAIGGGAGGKYYESGEDGGSGGGGGGHTPAADDVGGSATAGQGYDGGTSTNTGVRDGGGGGGGAGSIGGANSGKNAGSGGAGLQSSISGSSVYYCAGGAGSPGYTSGAYGDDGTGFADAANRGHGGTTNTPVDGSSGVVIIRYLTR